MKQSNLFGLLSFVCLIDISPSASLHALVEPHAVAYYRAEYVVAMKAYKTLAEKGCIDAPHFVGTMCQTNGGGVPRDYSVAAKCFLLAAEGEGMATLNLRSVKCTARAGAIP